MSGTLYVVGTPIGNLRDFSERAIETLNNVDFIAAEDTRVSLKLLNHFGIKKQLVSYYEQNSGPSGEKIIKRLLNEENAAIITDAGMPAISDPGRPLIADCLKLGIKVESVPGPTAFATAVAISGMGFGRFTFEGFLSINKKARAAHLNELINEKRTMVFYEAPHKLKATLNDFLNVFGNRNIAIIKELTKVHENIDVTTLNDAVKKYCADNFNIKGEFVLVLDGKPEEKKIYTFSEALDLAKAFKKTGFSNNESAKKAAGITGIKKSDIYKSLMEE